MGVFPGRPEEGVGYPGTGDGGSWESPERLLGSELRSSGRKSNVLTLIHLSRLIKVIVKYTAKYLEKLYHTG